MYTSVVSAAFNRVARFSAYNFLQSKNKDVYFCGGKKLFLIYHLDHS